MPDYALSGMLGANALFGGLWRKIRWILAAAVEPHTGRRWLRRRRQRGSNWSWRRSESRVYGKRWSRRGRWSRHAEFLLDQLVHERGGIQTATRTDESHGLMQHLRLDLEGVFRAARALKFHGRYGLGFNKTTP